MENIQGRTFLITGATDGIGEITARKLARGGADLILHGRDEEKCRRTAGEIEKETGNERISFYVADFSDLSQVRRMGEAVAADRYRLDVLINNAGVLPSGDERRVSRDGHELAFAVNHLAPFLLTHLLLPLLREGDRPRIVNVSSTAQEALDFDDPMMEKGKYNAMSAYSRSKLALAMFTFELAERVREDAITVNCLHPGSLLDTKMVRRNFSNAWGSAESGADVEVYVATDPELEGVTGRYFDEKTEAKADIQAGDAAARTKLWEISRELTGAG